MFRATQLHGFATRRRQVEINSVTAAGSTTDTTLYSFAGTSIGNAADDRYVIVGVMGQAPATSRTITGVTIAGTNASLIVSATANGGGVTDAAELWGLVVPTGTTATIAVGTSGNYSHLAIEIWTLNGANFAAHATSFDNSAVANVLSTTIACPSNGAVIACAYTYLTAGTATATWGSDLTERFDATLELSTRGTHGASTGLEGQARTLTAQLTSGGTMTEGVMAVASFSPR